MEYIDIVDSKDLSAGIFENVRFFSLAEGGAMGAPGEVIVINAKKEIYVMNYIHDNVSIAEIEHYFPALADSHFGLFGLDSTVPFGWKYVNLGFGNHLIVADEVYGAFCAITKDCKEPVEYYTTWIDAAKTILGIATKCV